MVTKPDEIKIDVQNVYRQAREKVDDKFAKETEDYEMKTSFLSSKPVVDFLESLGSSLNKDISYWVSVEERWTKYEDKFQGGISLILRISSEDEEAADVIRGSIQRVYHAPATRSVNNYDGSISYNFIKSISSSTTTDENDEEVFIVPGTINVSIGRGSLAPSCEVIEVIETVKRFEIKCPEGMEGIVQDGNG